MKPIIEKSARFSDLIITPSLTAKNEIESMFGIPSEKVHACYHMVNQAVKYMPHVKKEKFILFVGNIDPWKNLNTLAAAFDALKRKGRHENTRLVIAGKKREGWESLRAAMEAHGIGEEVSVLGYVSSDTLVKLYNSAELVVIPSLYEGFGIPVIEAMACRTPVVASDIPVFREIAGEAALLYGVPPDVGGLADAIHEVLSNASLKEELVARGTRQVLHYSREAFIQRHINAYNAVYSA
jgi:glycosyltransferase involved in cell wall biosynthesis